MEIPKKKKKRDTGTHAHQLIIHIRRKPKVLAHMNRSVKIDKEIVIKCLKRHVNITDLKREIFSKKKI